MLRPVDAAADEDAPLAAEYGHADAATIRQGFEAGLASAPIVAGVARGTRGRTERCPVLPPEGRWPPKKRRGGGPRAAPRVGVGSRRALVWHRGLRIRRVSRVLLDAADEIERGV